MGKNVLLPAVSKIIGESNKIVFYRVFPQLQTIIVNYNCKTKILLYGNHFKKSVECLLLYYFVFLKRQLQVSNFTLTVVILSSHRAQCFHLLARDQLNPNFRQFYSFY